MGEAGICFQSNSSEASITAEEDTVGHISCLEEEKDDKSIRFHGESAFHLSFEK